MGGSIHIHGTGSSIVDTVFVCRTEGSQVPQHLFSSTAELIPLVRDELDQLRVAGMKPTAGDIRCITYGHAVRMAIWKLRNEWPADKTTKEKLTRFSQTIATFGDLDSVIQKLRPAPSKALPAVPPVAPIQKKQRSRDAVSL
jgi:hypothetical protein